MRPPGTRCASACLPRTGSDDGAGLGLSIVAAITHAHHGSLRLDARPDGGLQVAVTLPLAARAVAAEVVA